MSIFDRFKKAKEQEVSSKGSAIKAAPVVDAASEEVKEDAKPKAKAKKAVATGKTASTFATRTILKPIVTEKTARLSDSNTMVFRVPRSASRIQVAQAIKELYGVRPVRVNILNVRGKNVHFGRTRGVQQDVKKAMVKLPEGTRLDIFEGV